MPSIFDTNLYAAGTTYAKNAIVKYNTDGLFYYSLQNGNVGNTPGLNSSFWGGRSLDPISNQNKPEFIWKSSYGSSVEINPKTVITQFGDGYNQRMKDGVNNQLMNLSLNFNGRGLDEMTAMVHFLYNRQGVEYFLFTPPPPFNKKKRFICRGIPTNLNFYQNNDLKVIFEEVAV